MKTLEKAEMIERNKVQRVLAEAAILGAVDHPFLASLWGTIVTKTHLHFLMEVFADYNMQIQTHFLLFESELPCPCKLTGCATCHRFFSEQLWTACHWVGSKAWGESLAAQLQLAGKDHRCRAS